VVAEGGELPVLAGCGRWTSRRRHERDGGTMTAMPGFALALDDLFAELPR
jgi:hypothetical protein